MVERRALQKERHELQRQWAELQERELSDLKASLSQSMDIILSLRTPPNPESLLPLDDDSQPPNTKIPKTAFDSRSLGQSIARIEKAQARQKLFVIRLSAPRWLAITSRVLEISGAKAPFGCDFSIRTYNIVSIDAPIMKYTRQDDVCQVKRLFSERRASLSDCTDYGLSILDVCVNPEIINSTLRGLILTRPRWQLTMASSKLSSF